MENLLLEIDREFKLLKIPKKEYPLEELYNLALKYNLPFTIISYYHYSYIHRLIRKNNKWFDLWEERIKKC